MMVPGLGMAVLGAAGALAWAVRGRSSTVLAHSVWRGPASRRAIALTFDDGPSESTPALLEMLERYRAKATFFQCGYHVRRLPGITRALVAGGHEPGNHTDRHPALYLRSPAFIFNEIAMAQEAITEAAGAAPRGFRAPFGARWFGLEAAQRALGLTGVMWTAIGRDWSLPAGRIAARLRRATRPGAILCLHDGRELAQNPDISSTLAAVAELLPWWREEGYEVLTVSELLAPTAPDGTSVPSNGRVRR
ncbi:MAG: polysaccharide deacetylase family protein [Bryobacteraceae bacterium]|nr:polysaccharide deacetylase family protein [Bryobacteraceae bacterium]